MEGQQLVFTAPDGSPIEPSTLTRHFTALCGTARLFRIRFHDLRHTAATLPLEQGVELVVIRELLGHAHIGVTSTVYTSDSASNATPSTSSATPSATPPSPPPGPTTATNRHFVQQGFGVVG
ncbi:integrase [Kitasatospora sp. MAP5-34]|nr:integrase [Kitasatospora sp. MAP5-34]